MFHLLLIYYVWSIICIYLRLDYDCVDGVEYSKPDSCLLLKERKKDVKKWLEARSRKSKLKKSFCMCQNVCLARVHETKFLLSKLSDNAEFLCLRVKIVSDINLSTALNVILSSENFFNYDYSLPLYNLRIYLPPSYLNKK